MNAKTNVVTKTEEIVEKAKAKTLPDNIAKMGSTSSQIRALHALGWTRGEIAKVLKTKKGEPLRYQHVRNVLTQPLKKA